MENPADVSDVDPGVQGTAGPDQLTLVLDPGPTAQHQRLWMWHPNGPSAVKHLGQGIHGLTAEIALVHRELNVAF